MVFQLSKLKHFSVIKIITGLTTTSRTEGYKKVKPDWEKGELLLCLNSETGMYEVITEQEVKEYLTAKQEEI